MKRIKEKIKEIKIFLSELKEIVPSKLEEYKSNKIVKAACERYIEKIVEGITDISFMIIKQKKFEIPEDDIDAFSILADKKIIKENLYQRLKEAKGMRNIIAHEYGKIDDNIIFYAVKDELEKDAEAFLKEVNKCL